MPIRKYRSVEEMPPPEACARGSAAHIRRWTALWARTTQPASKRVQPGVVKFTAIDDPRRTSTSAASDPAGANC